MKSKRDPIALWRGEIDGLREWMLRNNVVSATMAGMSLTLHPSAFAPRKESAFDQPQGQEVDFPEELQDQSAEALMFFSSHAGPPPSKEE